MITELTNLSFPPLEQALQEPNGLLAVGGDLSAERLEAAYRHGCFPWFNEGDPILWWSPNPRTVLFPEELHISRSMRKVLDRAPYHVTFNQCFLKVIKACAGPRNYTNQTWISPAMQQAYFTLYKQGLAHSVEVWQEQELIGGLYGLALGRLFFGESMFSLKSNASKFGFIHLVQTLKEANFVLIDCQVHSDHLQSLGARNISRNQFSDYLKKYADQTSTINWQTVY